MASSPVPGVLARMPDLVRSMPADRGGALWRLAESGRQLDANVVRLAPGAEVAEHVEPDLDVLVYVVNGSGRLGTGDDELPLEGGAVVWLPRGSRRALSAGPHGLDYLTVHRRRPGMSIRPASGGERADAERPVEERSVGDRSVGERSVGERSVGERSVGERSVGAWSVAERSVEERSVAEQSVAEQSVDERLNAPSGGERSGGEPACLLDRVCPECGRLAPDESDVRFCGRCGSRLPER